MEAMSSSRLPTSLKNPSMTVPNMATYPLVTLGLLVPECAFMIQEIVQDG